MLNESRMRDGKEPIHIGIGVSAGRGGGGHGGQRGADGIHRDRRQRQPRLASRVQCQARPDPDQPAHVRDGARPRRGACRWDRSRSRARRSRWRFTRCSDTGRARERRARSDRGAPGRARSRWSRWRCSRAPARRRPPSALRRGPRPVPHRADGPRVAAPAWRPLPEVFDPTTSSSPSREPATRRRLSPRAIWATPGVLDDRELHGQGQLRRGRGSDHPREALESRRRGARRLPDRAHPLLSQPRPRRPRAGMVLAASCLRGADALSEGARGIASSASRISSSS